jgi:hypothetical protein
MLQINREGLPVWLAEMRRDLQAIGTRSGEEVERWSHRLENLSQRVDNALRRAEAARAGQPTASTNGSPWAAAALAYLDRRLEGGAPSRCPLPELFSALRQPYPDLTMTGFHDGLRRLRDHQALRLLPFAGQPADLPQPEYALLDGTALLYYVER